MKYFKTKNVHEKLQLLIKFYKNGNTAWYVNLSFANQAGITRRWLKLQMKHNCVSIYNILPKHMREISCPKLFKKTIKNFLLENAFYSTEEFVSG